MLKKVMIGMAFIISILTFWGCTASNTETAENKNTSPSEHETVSEDENIGSFEYETVSESENTSPFEYKTVSEGENTCRISEIRIKKDKGISELKIPGTIDGKTVVSIGEERKLNKWREEVDWNAFIMYEDPEIG